MVVVREIFKKADDLYFSQRNKRHLVLSPMLGTWLTCDNKRVKIIHMMDGKTTVKQIADSVGMSEDDVIEFGKKGYEYGLITISGNSKYPDDIVRRHINTNAYPQLCLLHVSNICNLACKYCYAHTEATKRRSMSLNTMRRAVDRFMELPSHNLLIEFHGGEPLIHYKNINKACEYALYVASRHKKAIGFAMQSNMTFLNDECINMINKYDIKIRISLDGEKEVNDYYRVNNNGEGSFDKIVENVKRLGRENIFPEVVVVVSKRNVDILEDIFTFFDSLNLRRIRLMPLWAQGMGRSLEKDVVDPKYYADKYLGIVDWIVNHNKAADPDNYISMLVMYREVEALCGFQRNFMCMRCPCGAGINMIDVSIDGDMYPCEEMNELEFTKLGNIFSESICEAIDKSEIVQELKVRNPDNIEECRKCPWKSFCQSGCANKNYQKYGKFESKSDKCEFYQHYFDNLIWYLDSNRDAVKYLKI